MTDIKEGVQEGIFCETCGDVMDDDLEFPHSCFRCRVNALTYQHGWEVKKLPEKDPVTEKTEYRQITESVETDDD